MNTSNKAAKKAKPSASAKAKANDPISKDPSPSIKTLLLFRKPSPFNIAPNGHFHPPLLEMYLDAMPTNYSKRHRYVEEHFPISSPFVGMIRPPSLFPVDPITPSWSKEKSSAIRKGIFRIMRLRTTFRKLLHKWRFSKLKPANTEDLVTAESPKKPVMLIDWERKQAYIFEAQTLMKDITSRLLHHDGLFEYTQPPRNPFTNIPLTQAQTIAVWNSISNSGIPVSTAFTLFRMSRYDPVKFIEENQTFLKLNALRKTFQSASCYDYREVMGDFIKYAYVNESLPYNYNAFNYVIMNYPNYRIILKWKELCLRFHEADILYPTNTLKLIEIKNKVLDDTYELLHSQTNIITLYNRSIRIDVV